MSELRIRPMRVEDEAEVRAAHKIMAADNFEFVLDLASAGHFDDYVERLANFRRGIDLPSDRVPAALLVADVGGTIVGRTSIRFELNDWLSSYGGHIGDGAESSRRRGGSESPELAWRQYGPRRARRQSSRDEFSSA